MRESSSPFKPRIADRMVASLLELGVEVVFGLPGGAISPIFDALAAQDRIRVVISKSEHGAITAASAYARHSGKVGVVLVTSGPGVLNAMNGLASAQREAIPVVLIGGDVSRGNVARNAVQDGSNHGLGLATVARQLCAASFDVARPGTADATLRKAFAVALADRQGAVYINLPIDIGMAADEPADRSSSIAPTQHPSSFDAAEVRRVSEALRTASRPLIIVGSGARFGDQRKLIQVAERFGVPVATTPKGKGVFPEDHPASLGVYGHGGHRSAHEYVEAGLDVLVVLGSSLNDAATHGWNAKLQAPFFAQVDIDPLQLGRNYTAHVGFSGRVDDFVASLLLLAPANSKPFEGTIAYDKQQTPVTSELIAPHLAIQELQRVLPQRTIYTCDIGEHLMFVTHYLRIAEPDGYFVMTGHASMGTALAAASGIKLAKPDRTTAAFVGDGGFLMSLADLTTAAQERLPIVVAVMNDFRYAMVELGHRKVYGRELKYPVPVDIVKLAEGCGAKAMTIRSPADMGRIEIPVNAPLVLDVRIDPSVTLDRVDRFEKRQKG